MPDRTIRDELLESERWLSLKDNGDRLAYIALLLRADAHGNFDAGSHRLMRLWRDFGIGTPPLVAKTLSELVEHDLVRLYSHQDQRYLHIPRYRQRLRYLKHTFPSSPWDSEEANQRVTKKSPGERRERTANAPGAHNRREVKRREVKLYRSSVPDDPAFDRFWTAYPRKVGKPKALQAWRRIAPDEATLATILASIEQQKRTQQWLDAGGRFIPHPTTWLNREGWNDNVVVLLGQQKKVAL